MRLSDRSSLRAVVAIVVATVVLLLAGTSLTPAAEAATCADFPNQAAAQQAANTRDADHDGIYCEDLPCPCSPAWYAQHDPSYTPPPPSSDPAPPSTDPTPPSSDPSPSSTPTPLTSSSSEPAPGSIRSRVPPLRDPRGLHPGLTRVPQSMLAAARRLIAKVRTAARGPKTGYTREKFGPAWADTAAGDAWAGNGCDTRDDILRRDLAQITFRPGTNRCVVATGRLRNPYRGTTIAFTKTHATLVQIDHVIPLSLAWQMGAAHWTLTKRKLIANDPLNLLAVDASSNASKGDSSPAEWLPANATIRCAYSVRVAQVARRYNLPLTRADKRTMLAQCRSSTSRP